MRTRPVVGVPFGRVSATADVCGDRARDGFRHDVLLYEGEDEFVLRIGAFVREGLERGEGVLVATSARKLELLGRELGAGAASVELVDMAEVGRNPACIIPVWQRFVDTQRGRGRQPRGVGEPVWPGRSGAELAECRRHESLLNLAFHDGPPWALLCPYDRTTLDPAVLAEAERTHPHVVDGAERRESACFEGDEAAGQPFAAPLPDPPPDALELRVDGGSLGELRRRVVAAAAAAGLDEHRRRDLVLAVNEIATNSVRHGGGNGTFRLWQRPDGVVCELHDDGTIEDPLAGRRRPELDRTSGRGLWLANHLCDLVELRSSPQGTVVRLHVRDRRADG